MESLRPLREFFYSLVRRRIVSMRKGFKVVLACSAVLAVLFAVIGGLGRGYEPTAVCLLAVSGAAIGAMGAPEFYPEVFRSPALWQVGAGVVSGLACAVAFSSTAIGLTLGGLVGAFIGFLAPYWVKHVNVP
jgi:hypothetical protein